MQVQATAARRGRKYAPHRDSLRAGMIDRAQQSPAQGHRRKSMFPWTSATKGMHDHPGTTPINT